MNDEKLEKLSENIRELKKDHGCSQATIMGIGNLYDMDESKLAVISSGFAGGIGGTSDEGTCGALTGSVLALGLIEDDPEQIKKQSKELYETFKKDNGSVCCGTLTDNGKEKSLCMGRCISMAEKTIELLGR